MEATPKPPLPWEHKAAIGCLVIVALQEIREILLLTLGHPGLMNLGPLSPLLLVVTMTVGVSVRSRRRSTWWWGGALLGAVGLFLIAAYWEAVRAGLGIGNPLQRISTVTEYEWIKGPSLDRFGLFWVICRNVMLLGAAMLLVLGEIRRRMRSG